MTYDKIERIEHQVSPTTPQQVSGAGAVSNKPIDFSQKTKEEQKSEVLSYIDSEEFKKLPIDEQLRIFKEKFCPSASSEDVQKYLSLAKQAVSVNKEIPSVASGGTKAAENQSVDNEHVENESDAGANDVNTEAMDEFEQLVFNYAKENKVKGSIDDVISSLLQKSKSGALSEQEQKILDQYNKNIEKAHHEHSEHNHKHEQSNLLIPAEELSSGIFMELTGKEKLEMFTKAYLEKHDEEYNNLSDKEKSRYLKNKLSDIAEMVGADKIRLSKSERNSRYNDAITLLQIAHGTNTDLEVYGKMSKSELKETIHKTQDALLKDFLTHVDPKALEGKTPEEKLKLYADHILSVTDKKYSELSGEEKAAYLDGKCKEFLGSYLGIDAEAWDGMPKEDQDKVVELSSIVICKFLENGGTITEFKNMSEAQKLNMYASYISEAGGSEENAKIAAKLQSASSLLEYFDLRNERPTNDKILNRLNYLVRSGKATEADKELLRKMQAYRKSDPVRFKKANFLSMMDSHDVQLQIRGEKFQKYAKNVLRDINTENALDEKNLKKMQKFVDRMQGNEEYLRTFINVLEEKGVSKAQIKEILGDETFAMFYAEAYAKGDGAEAARVANTATSYGSQEAKSVGDKFIENSSAFLAPKQLKVFGTEVAKIEECVQPLTKSIANREFVSKEDAADITTAILRSESLPDANKALVAKSTIESVAQNGPEEQLFFGSALSKVSIPAVTEGLAAASKSVDESVRTQYESYVQTAAANYPPETQSAIKSAMTTGEISKATLAKTASATPAPDAPASEGSSRTAEKSTGDSPATPGNNGIEGRATAQVQAQSTNQKPFDNRTKVTSPSASVVSGTSSLGRVSSSAMEEVPSGSSESVNKSSAKTIDAAEAASFETAALEAKKAAAMQNALDTKESIEQAQADREIEQVINEATQDVIEELALEGQISQSDKEKIVSQLKKATTINEVYEIVSKIGGQDIFLDRLSSGSEFYITSFVKNINNPSLVQDLYLRCSSESVKKQLLNNLPQDYVYSMLDSRRISNMKDVDKNILRNYILKNINSMRSSDFTEFLSYLSLYDREELVNRRNAIRNTNQPEAAQSSQTSQTESAIDTPQLPESQELTDVNNKTAAQASKDYNKQKKSNNTSSQKIGAGEITKTLADGSVITRQGTTFGGVSAGAEDDLFRKVSEEELKGNPKGMDDEILTPGSEEWRRKYNKQQAVPATAFTTASFEEDEEFGISFGSSKVGMRKQIKKKGRFYYNG